MAGKVFFSVTMSLDGFIAPEEFGRALENASRMDDPDAQRWMAQWMELQQWIFPQRFIRENLKLGEGGEEGRDNDIVGETFERTGASVMGKRMFDLGEQAWPEEAPFHTPVFVVTHEKPDPWQRARACAGYCLRCREPSPRRAPARCHASGRGLREAPKRSVFRT